ncbi:transcriptional regulator [Shewanella sp. UCD-FRSSP16_17]|uniref:metalloregulator ArsR/SmtB family transcription factor n=1 Tax=unclassified Shewanella TaxID=196818 RepID=UPI0007EEC9F1|nr:MULTISPECIES: metalloregulator ArsR/SmtB family transcription factor [unclassified Shewanella]MBQ4889518.1 metalloregulator ArsR/SmtB family transcription factor [Shewanella sp. MMG014]OBT08284.1 transcriptional regulator [Shewanella sp. UCD-FRSSP16_17]
MQPNVFFKCLADETRLRSLLLISVNHELCVCELMAALNDSQPKISRHLAQLRKEELLVDRRQGKWVYYRVNPQLPQWIQTMIAQTAESNSEFIANDVKRLAEMPNRPNEMCC